MNYLNIPKRIFLSTLLLLSTATIATAQNVYIPDANFKAALLANTAINKNGDDEIQVSEAQYYSGLIDVSDKNISSLVGIEAFTGISNLNCRNNQLTSLDASKNIFVENLDCSGNQLTSLILSNSTALKSLSCFNNQLTNLDVSKNTGLFNLGCSNNLLKSLDVSKNTTLGYLTCSDNLLTSLKMNNNNTALLVLNCDNNQLTSLDASGNKAMTSLNCINNQLITLDVSENIALTSIVCTNNQLTSLTMSKNTALTTLTCLNNQLASLDLSSCVNLQTLNSLNNQLVNVNIKNGHNTLLTNINFFNNPDLSCIQVDDVAYMDEKFPLYSIHYKTSSCDGNVSIKSSFRAEFKIYPTPATTQLTIDTDETILSKAIMGLDGMVIQEENNNLNTLDISHIPTGFYLIRLKTQQGVYKQKFVKE
jgi:Leucine-rich repeat (LRR) protein